MNEKLREFLDAAKADEKKKYEEEKNKTLLNLGLYERVYSEDDNYSEAFPFYEWDSDTSTTKYYKKVPIEITDEEYKEVKKYSKEENTTEFNPIAMALNVIAWAVFIVGFIAGIVLGNVEIDGYYYSHTEFSFVIAFTYWSVALISGTMFLGFAEIIKLLDAIKNK